MEDIRRPQRRDYALPQSPTHHPHHPPAQPVHHIPIHHAPAHPQPAPIPQPAYQPTPQPTHHQPQPVHHPHTQPAHQPHAQPKTAKRFSNKLLIGAGVVAIAIGLFAGGYFLKPSSPANSLPSAVVKQANFDVYFPSPMPSGYTYMKDTALFDVGDVFYKFSNGNKRVTVREEPVNGNKQDLGLLAGFSQFDAPVGHAAVGTSLGESTGVVVTNTTIITMNSSGGVSQDDLKTAINSFKNIGSNTQKNQ